MLLIGFGYGIPKKRGRRGTTGMIEIYSYITKCVPPRIEIQFLFSIQSSGLYRARGPHFFSWLHTPCVDERNNVSGHAMFAFLKISNFRERQSFHGDSPFYNESLGTLCWKVAIFRERGGEIVITLHIGIVSSYQVARLLEKSLPAAGCSMDAR